MPFGNLHTPNITHDKITGLGLWTEEMFINRFKYYDPENGYEDMNADMNEYNTGGF